ncbi:hypothetical protein DFR29_103175 [Tahibacter aquaticus]|uniref:Uncharacterized protein n=1 Tax=Tahibacter aquaticus TaxID=520092 RepID=A0A4R6Z505_9GAMM|nr:hypothetical protein DFR29_103175 [Tahibacter aquaticus]
MARSWDDRVNALSDQDWAWWPLLSLRPLREQALSHARLLQIVLGFGGVCACFSVLLYWLLFDTPDWLVAASLAGVTVALFYAAARLTLYRSWNRRAARLRSDVDPL